MSFSAPCSTWIGSYPEVGELPLTPAFSQWFSCWTKPSVLFLLTIKQHTKKDVSKPAAWLAPKVVLAVCWTGLGDRQGFVTKFCRHPQYNRFKKKKIFIYPEASTTLEDHYSSCHSVTVTVTLPIACPLVSCRRFKPSY